MLRYYGTGAGGKMSYHPDAATVAAREQMDIRAGYRRFIRRALDTSVNTEVGPGCGEMYAVSKPSEDTVTLDREACSCPAPGR